MSQQDSESALRECQERSARLQQRLKEVERELELLAYSISHDLRAPLRAIKGFSEALVEDYAGKLDSEGQRYLNIVSGSAEQIARLIDGVLIYSRMGRQELRPSLIQMRELVQGVIAELTAKHSGCRVEFQLRALPEAWGDLNLVRQIWVNLIDNAIKFTRPRAPGIVEIGATEQDGQVAYFVKDNGVGFDMKYAEKLFGVFQRFHPEKEFEGAGVGLAVVQRLVRRHGGRVWAEAAPGEGATFWFCLPRQPEAS